MAIHAIQHADDAAADRLPLAVCGLGVVAARIGVPAHRYFQQHLQASGIADVLSTQLPKSQAKVVVRFRNATASFARGRFPQKSCKARKTSSNRWTRTRRSSRNIANIALATSPTVKSDLGRQAEVAVQSLTVNVDYYSKLAAKYQQAMREPWLPVEPDGPRP